MQTIFSRQVQIRRGSETEHNEFTGAIGEITMDTTNKTIRVHDSETVGGTRLAKYNELTTTQLDWDNKIVYTNQTQIIVPKNGVILCRGNPYSLDWVESDFVKSILVEYILSNDFTTVWAPVFTGQCFKERDCSTYNMLMFIPYKEFV